jgi:CPA1 family monovalent cation:H+ antiporter
MVVIACTVLVATLLLPGFTLRALVRALVRALGVAEDAGAEHAAEEVVARRARKAALERMAAEEHAADLPDEVSAALHDRMGGLSRLLRGEPPIEALRRGRDVVQRIQNEALAAARAEVLAARREPGIDPEAADRVLMRLDLRTVLLD